MSVAVDDRAPRLRGRELLRTIAEGTAGAVGDEFLRCLVRNVAEALGARLAFVAEATTDDGGHVRALACWHDGAFPPSRAPSPWPAGGSRRTRTPASCSTGPPRSSRRRTRRCASSHEASIP